MKVVKAFFGKETVFCISFILAIVSMFIVRPDAEYINYPDYRTLSLLFCLMIIVAGFQALGVFTSLGNVFLNKAGSRKKLSVILVMLCFFASMIITNDVALITFVPFTIMMSKMIGPQRHIIKLIVLETVAANLGSMATPIGNPQNLYIFSYSGISGGEFLTAVLPYAGLSLIILVIVSMIGRDEPLIAVSVQQDKKRPSKSIVKASVPYLALLIICLLVVFRVIHYLPALICVAAVVFIINRRLFASVDYFLLLTFLCFFVFIGNIKRIPQVDSLLASVIGGRELITGVIASQGISNVPAAILLSGFTDDFPALLTGVNIGGLGTLIASLASLISFKFYSREYPETKGKYLRSFTIWNVIFLAVLLAEAFVLHSFF
jgi:Na+/H+ antiporter NhaD/arsenite permease-like protein